MNQLYETVLAIARTSLFGAPLEIPEETDWADVYREMQQQAIGYLPAAILSDLPGLPEKLRNGWSYASILSMRRFYHILQEQEDILNLLHDHGIKAVVLKGAATAIYYPNPDQRTMGDVDLLVEQGKADDAMQLMLEDGFIATVEIKPGDRHHHLCRNGVEIELHSRFSLEGEVQTLDDMLYQAIQKENEGEINGFSFPVLPDLENGLMMLVHTSQHMREGIGLRHLLDWAVYADAILDDAYWHTTFHAEAERLGLTRFAQVLTRLSQMYLGLTEENHTWCRTADDKVCTALLEYVLEGGNFGEKRGDKKAPSMILTGYKGIFGLLPRLQAEGCRNFAKQIERFPILKPFAWLMRIVRLLVLGVKSGIHVGDLKAAFEDSRSRIELLDQLGLDTSIREHH